MNDCAITTESLTKQYGNVMAVTDLSLRVKRGETFGFLGPNGAGKSTSLKMLVALILPTSGTGTILGKPIGDRLVRARIGLLPEHFRYHETLTARELLKFHGRLYGMNRRDIQEQSDRLLLRVGLDGAADRPMRDYSKGMAQRLGLAQSLINRPDLVFWDEPTSALDPLGRLLVRDLIRELRDQGVTVFLNSHLLGEVESVCERVAFVKEGRVVKDIEIAKLPATQHVHICIDRDTNSLINEFARFGRVISTESRHATIEFLNRETIPEFVRWLFVQNIGLYELQSKRMSLEELFIDTIGTTNLGEVSH